MNKLTFSLIATSVLFYQSVFAQSVGVNFVNNGNASGIDDAETDSMLPSDFAGVPQFAQSNWNNFGRYGSLDPVILTNSAGGTNAFSVQWDAGGADTTSTGAGLSTPDGKLMDGFIYSWGPGAATPLASSCYGSSINNKPVIYLSGLHTWYTNAGAEGYSVVLYTTGYPYYETIEGWLQSVTGRPFDNSMVEGTDLAAHVFAQDQHAFLGTYVQAVGTSSANQTGGANYMFFTGLTNDAILLRCQSGGYGAGLNGFQVVPIFPGVPTASLPTFSPSDTVYSGVPVTISEAASGDPFHPQLWYQWQKDSAGSGIATNNIQDQTNAVLNVLPTNSVSSYTISYQCIVSNIFGAVTSAPVVLNVNPAVAPIVSQDTTPGAGNNASAVFAYVGGTVSFSAAFGDTPSTYLWQSNLVDMLGQTNTTLTLNNVQLSSSANYQLTATNSVGGVASTPAALTVLTAPPTPTSTTPYAYDVLTNAPAAYWRFTETADNVGNSLQAYDYSGNNHDATYGNGASLNYPGPQPTGLPGFESTNTAVSLQNNVQNSFLTVPPLKLNTNTVTITAWINPSGNESANNGLLMWVNGSDKAGFGFGGNLNAGMAELGYTWNTNSPATYNFHSGLFPPSGQWSFAALVITPTNSTLYLDYIDANTGATNLQKAVQTINNLVEPFNGGTTWIGSDSFAGRNFNGTLDEVAVFSKAMTDVQVQDLFLKGIGATGVLPAVGPVTTYPASTVYSGQNVLITVSNVSGSVPLTLQWQASPNGTTWTNIPGANAASFVANPQVVGSIYYQLTAGNSIGSSASSSPAQVTFNALPATPPGLWTVNYQITNNVINYATGGGVGYYSGRGILGNGMYWNVLPDTGGSFGTVANIQSVSDLKDDGATHSGIYCNVLNGNGFGSATVPLPPYDLGNLLYQYVNIGNGTNGLQFHGLPDGTYNLALYGCDAAFGDRGTVFVVHDALNGDQTTSTVNASPIVPLNQGVNFALFTNVHVSGGNLYIDVLPNSPLPSHSVNTEADFNAVQLQLVSYDVAAPPVYLTNGVSGTNLTLNWPQGVLQSATNLLGPWTTIVGPSPATVPLTNSDQFFRIQVR
jgi:hypothetical protein